jgi:hypothetical protein
VYCDDVGLAIRDEARNQGTIATVVFTVGAASAAGGVLLWLLAPPEAPPLDVQPSAHGFAVRASGRF